MINTEILLENKVCIGDEFKHYSDLCKYIGIPVTTGKQRQLDQRHLRCYFDWEKKEHSNKLTISDTYYDNPKEFIDQRNGTHITPTIEKMMNLFLFTEWEDDFYSKSKMLYEMELFNDEVRKKTDSQQGANPRITVEKDYSQKMYGHINATINQINKSGLGSITPQVVNIKTKKILHYEFRSKFYDIRKKALNKFGEKNEGGIYKHKKWAQYREEIDNQTLKEFNQFPIYERYELSIYPPQDIEPISREDFLNHVGEEMIRTYTRKHEGAIGCVSPKAYEQSVKELIAELLKDYLSKREKADTALKEIVTITPQYLL